MPSPPSPSRFAWSAALLTALLLLGGCGAERASGQRPAVQSVEPVEAVELTGRRQPGRYRVTLLAEGRELEFLGEVTRQSAAALQAALLQNPGIEVLQLTGPGGDMVQAQRLGRLVAELGLTTYVPLECVSACAELFLGGQERFLAPGSALGFHRVWVAGLGAGSELERSSNDRLLQDLLDRGIAGDFAARVVATPHETVWYPAADEMVAAGVIDGVRPRADFAAPSTGEDTAALLDWSSLNHDTLWAFQAAYPDRHRALRLALFAGIREEGFDLGQQDRLIDEVMSEAFGQALATGGEGELVAFFGTVRDAALFMAATNPAGCGSLALSTLDLVGPEAAIAERLGARADNAVAAVFRSVAEGRGRPAPSRDDYEGALSRFAAGLVASGLFDDREWMLFDHAERDPPRFCLVFAKLMDAMLAAPPEMRSALLRGFALYE